MLFVFVNLVTDLCYAVINPGSGYRSPLGPADSRPLLKRWFRRYGQILIALPFLLALVVLAFGAPLLLGHDPNRVNPRVKVQSPSAAYLLGTDEFGRDILSRLAYGARITLLVAVASVILAAAGGTLLGTVAAYAGRGAETVIMRTMDGMLCFHRSCWPSPW